jgi:hypothetical protein
MLPPSLVQRFPKLVADGGKKTSEATRQYNCIAWSAERDELRWWQPDIVEPWDYWPPELPPGDYSFENFIRLFENRGYKQCADSNFEMFYKKVAIYAIYGYFEPDEWGFSHVCDELHSGAWTSKLGPFEDIRHNSLQALAGYMANEYGEIRVILKRRCGVFGVLARIFFKLCFSILRLFR